MKMSNIMKMFSKLIVLAFALCSFWACNDDDSKVSLPEPVTYAKVAGIWQLTQWNGEALNDSRYCYIVLGRSEHTIDMYQNFDSSKSRHITGTYSLKDDEDLGTLIEGVYDHGSGFWNNTYIISNITDKTMTWVVSTDPPDVTVYTRCASVPEDVLNGTRSF